MNYNQIPPICALIPARYGSSRLNGKPLLLIDGKTVIHRTLSQTQKSNQDCALSPPLIFHLTLCRHCGVMIGKAASRNVSRRAVSTKLGSNGRVSADGGTSLLLHQTNSSVGGPEARQLGTTASEPSNQQL